MLGLAEAVPRPVTPVCIKSHCAADLQTSPRLGRRDGVKGGEGIQKKMVVVGGLPSGWMSFVYKEASETRGEGL